MYRDESCSWGCLRWWLCWWWWWVVRWVWAIFCVMISGMRTIPTRWGTFRKRTSRLEVSIIPTSITQDRTVAYRGSSRLLRWGSYKRSCVWLWWKLGWDW